MRSGGCLLSVVCDIAQLSSKINNRYASIANQSPLTYSLFDIENRKVIECGAVVRIKRLFNCTATDNTDKTGFNGWIRITTSLSNQKINLKKKYI